MIEMAKVSSPMVKRWICAGLAPLALWMGSLPAHADQAPLVPGTSDIWLAGQPNGSTVTGYFGTDTAPGNSPVGVTVAGGYTVTFSVMGYTPVTVDGGCFDSNADAGSCYADEFSFSPGPANGISLAHLPAGALVGVFVASGGPSGSTPTALNFTGTGGMGTNFASLSPQLDQLFFIGDGLTGTGTGSAQTFIAPTGAATLYLAIADSLGASGNNSGGITADVHEVAPAAAPEPSSVSLVGLGMAGMLLMVKFARDKAALIRG